MATTFGDFLPLMGTSMPTCLYCKESTTGGEGDAHVLPEAVVKNGLTMPPGRMCDGCNNYFSRLDSALANHPAVAFGIQTFSLPGKAGKPRMKLGYFERDGGRDSRSIRVPREGVKFITQRKGRPFIALTPPTGEDRRRFHRSLYYVAFNVLSMVRDMRSVLEPAFDPVRKYIRSPEQGEIWPYCHARLEPEPVDCVDLLVLKSPTPQVLLRLFNHLWVVDLFRSTSLRQQLVESTLGEVGWEEVS